ncbi:hypothetical protein [Vulcaniibacterium tengchongense]|uniref:Uncharacterized protein n=1 Tax=Vulcaniibacterium tengchongense TaxID=1273429 RepID=A0A3N4V6K5_9GAMM|nr:hypothetical protein [Vulcaniibacterium tengchongense]RPE76975.1 hypothetical protein EDC50_2227 [Vulcaniibacterium tengchongense]
MSRRDESAPPAPDTRPGRNPGYSEPEPRHKNDVKLPPPPNPPDREPREGGGERPDRRGR